METIIQNGVTIIKMKPQPDKKEYSKTGVPGVYTTDGKMKLEVGYKGKRYYFGVQKSLEDARTIRELADKHIEDGTFIEWYESNKGKYVKPKSNHCKKGLYYRKERKKYQLFIYHNNESYYIGQFADKEDAILLRDAADKHIEAGTFEEWFEELKESRKNK